MATLNQIDEAVAALESGSLVVIPTDTLYGVAARADLPHAVEAIFAAKERPKERALPVLGANVAALRSVAAFDQRALELAATFWPGPLTLVLPRATGFGFDLGGIQDGSVAVRVPASPHALAVLERSGPLAVTSANISGQAAAVTVAEARAALRDSVAVYIDGGPAAGAPSTVLSLLGEPKVLRAGGLAADLVLRAAGPR
ncbi:MAG: L-threonylcarbamoyladenylate synthase [Actinomycetota bacterium]|nr:L-threonylcarbamoyladenylate synthase [Actinomycetota bacterium]